MSTTAPVHRIHRKSPVTHSASSHFTPSIQEQLHYVNPNRDLSNYYIQKLEKLDEDYNDLANKLCEFKRTYQHQYKLEMQLRQRDEETSQLQKALSDLQISFLEERAKKTNVIAENSSLQQTIDEYQERIRQLLSAGNLTGTSVSGTDQSKASKSESHVTNQCSQCQCNSFRQKLKTLEIQLGEKDKLYQLQVDIFTKDREILLEEMKAKQFRDTQRTVTLNNRLKLAQQQLHDNTKDYMQIQKGIIASEKQSLLQKDQNCFGYKHLPCSSLAGKRGNIGTCTKFQDQTKSRNKCCEHTGSCNHTITDKAKADLLKEISSLKNKFESLDERRHLQIEGFQSDIKQLRSQLSHIENELFHMFYSFYPEKEIRMQNVTRSPCKKKFSRNIEELKKKLQQLENRLKML